MKVKDLFQTLQSIRNRRYIDQDCFDHGLVPAWNMIEELLGSCEADIILTGEQDAAISPYLAKEKSLNTAAV